MNFVIIDFKKRVAEIEIYFSLLESIEEKNSVMYFPDRKKSKKYDKELIKILKAGLFLLLYNLSESTIRQGLTAIYDEISSQNIKYVEAIDLIKKIWISHRHDNFKGKGVDAIFNAINNMSDEIIQINFDNEKIISGNIDGRKITEFSKKYGFSCKVHKNAKNGNKLHQVKVQRNSLAHGSMSFSECGRNYTVNELRETKHQVVMYLRWILKNIEYYISNKLYLE